jgi:hypothetical protein
LRAIRAAAFVVRVAELGAVEFIRHACGTAFLGPSAEGRPSGSAFVATAFVVGVPALSPVRYWNAKF